MTALARTAVGAILVTAALAVALALAPGDRGIAVAAYALCLAGLLVAGAVTALQHRLPRAARPRERAPVVTEKPLPQLEWVARSLELGATSAIDLHARLRPLVSQVVAARLARRRGIDLARQPDRAQAVLSGRLWELVRPDRGFPEDRMGAGWSAEELAAAVSDMESI